MKLVTVIGARPQFVKAAPVSKAIADRDGIEECIVHTGQHFDDRMSQVFFDELAIPAPQYNLGIGGGPHGQNTGRMLEGVERVLLETRPDRVLVYGDTDSTLAGALAAAKLHIPVAHVEAGLRSFNRRMPEELNRVLTDHVSTHLFCPTRTAVANLAAEGITRGVHHVGDVMYDATLRAAERAQGRTTLEALGLREGEYSVATVHRAENTDDPARLQAIIDYLRAHAETRPIVLPIHPRTRQAIARLGLATTGLRVVEPLGYLDMARLLAGCVDVLTDSGGLQKEAYFHRKPCVTLRDETEWVETVDAGWNRLWQTDGYAPRREIDEYGQGASAEAIVALLA